MGGDGLTSDVESELARLRESEDRFRALVETTSDWIWEVDAAGTYRYCSAKVREILGYEPAEVVGKALFDFMPTEEAERVRGIFQHHVEAKLAISVLENRFLHQDGHVVVLETSGIPILDADGKLRGYRGIDRDISARKRSERSLRAQHELAVALSASFDLKDATQHMLQAASLLEGVDCGGAYIVDRKTGEIDLVHYLGLSEPFIAANSHYAADSQHAQIIRSGAPVFARYDEIAPRLDGVDEAEKLRAIAVIPIRYRNKAVGALNLASHTVDVFAPSVQQDIVALTAQMGGAIHRVVIEEERKNLEEQVQHAQKLESLGVLAGGIAHDFNNLLMGILGNASLVLMDLPPESPARPGVLDIEQTAKRAAELVRQLLAYSGKGKFVVEPITLSALVAEMVHLLELTVSKNVSLTLELEQGALAIHADATQLRQVVVNLITNASDALDDESGVVCVRTGTMVCDRQFLSETYLDDDLPNGMYAYIEVSDTGCGMDRETQSKIFDPFFTTKFSGRGLGLAAVLGIVRSHCGAIKVYSEPGQGTTLKVLFPVVESESPRSRPEVQAEATVRGAGRAVLVVDDEETVRRVAGRMLRRLGFEVVAAEDGQQALDLFQSSPDRFALVLLDFTMPRMGGETCFRHLRELEPSVPVILSSGHNEQELAARFTGKGVNGFIQKPYQLAALEALLKRVLGG